MWCVGVVYDLKSTRWMRCLQVLEVVPIVQIHPLLYVNFHWLCFYSMLSLLVPNNRRACPGNSAAHSARAGPGTKGWMPGGKQTFKCGVAGEGGVYQCK